MLYRKNKEFKFILGKYDLIENKLTLDDYIRQIVIDSTPLNKTPYIVETST